MNTPTIYALSTAPGRAGVAVIRVTGDRVRSLLGDLVDGVPSPRMVALREIVHPASRVVIDRGLVVWFEGPRSFTGEDAFELHLHGGRAVVRAMLEALAGLEGVREADPGEFTRRAFENGKIDLTEVEGFADLIDAETEAQRVQALGQASGVLTALYERWRDDLVAALALMESLIDFSDEVTEGDRYVLEVEARVRELHHAMSDHLDDGHRGEILRDGFRVALLGPPNAGKSSLLNALARREAAIVSPEAGTTRDVIEVRLDLAGMPVIISDTAGLREAAAAGVVEQEGMRRSLAVAKDAQLALWLVDAAAPSPEVPQEVRAVACDVVRVINKVDLLGGQGSARLPWCRDDDITISVTTGEGMRHLESVLSVKARAAIPHPGVPALTQARHRVLIEEAREALEAFLAGGARPLELRAEDLRFAALALGKITGRVDVEDVLDQIFNRFCIGK